MPVRRGKAARKAARRCIVQPRTAYILQLPTDLLLQICEEIVDKKNARCCDPPDLRQSLARIGRTCRAIRAISAMVLYRHIRLNVPTFANPPRVLLSEHERRLKEGAEMRYGHDSDPWRRPNILALLRTVINDPGGVGEMIRSVELMARADDLFPQPRRRIFTTGFHHKVRNMLRRRLWRHCQVVCPTTTRMYGSAAILYVCMILLSLAPKLSRLSVLVDGPSRRIFGDACRGADSWRPPRQRIEPAKFDQLVHLDVKWAPWARDRHTRDASLAIFFRSVANIKSLCLENPGFPEGSVLASVVFPRLESLKIGRSTMTVRHLLSIINNCTGLREFVYEHGVQGDLALLTRWDSLAILRTLARHRPTLERLVLTAGVSRNEKGCAHELPKTPDMRGFKALRELTIHCWPCQGCQPYDFCRMLQQCPALEQLTMENNCWDRIPYQSLAQLARQAAKGLFPKLRVVRLVYAKRHNDWHAVDAVDAARLLSLLEGTHVKLIVRTDPREFDYPRVPDMGYIEPEDLCKKEWSTNSNFSSLRKGIGPD
ncbi:hypothetical protein QBC47DRAFT_401253 [Echria macrotheca]|uniref:Uncharacterized protein n=1 Tax=Echria macrotheca TaxID=438768 RepID=A0AAJ0BFV7_9PEZI|nr:hypothetical protein QBC47DRAFT_401253 [Echria macrotheca]